MINFEPNEKILKVVRRHYFVITPTIIGLLMLALLPIFIYFIVTSSLLSFPVEVKSLIAALVDKWGIFAYSLWILTLWIIFFIEWTDFYLDLWIISDKRVIDMEQKGFFHREVTSFTYDQIQDITVETRGLIETLLKFGTLHIQTAGHLRDIKIRDAYNPEEARSLILRQPHGFISNSNSTPQI